MASCLAKIGLKRQRKRENNNYRYVPFLPDAKQKIPKKQQKKFKKLTNTIMASFQAKIGRKRTRKRENKNYYYISLLPDTKLKIPRKQQKNSKKSKYTIMPLFQAKIGVVKCRERENLKIIVPFRSNPTRNRKSQKNSKKIQKFKKYHYAYITSQNRLEMDEKQRK